MIASNTKPKVEKVKAKLNGEFDIKNIGATRKILEKLRKLIVKFKL